jgi:hypothetical protein
MRADINTYKPFPHLQQVLIHTTALTTSHLHQNTTMSLKIRQAQQQWEDSNSRKAFYERIAKTLTKTEVVIDHDSIKALPGTCNLRDMWHAGENPVPALVYWILCDTAPYTCRTLNDVCTAFELALPDDMSKEAAKDIEKLVIKFAQDDKVEGGTSGNAAHDVSKDGKTWTLTIRRNWNIALDISGVPGFDSAIFKDYILNNL